MLGHFRSSLIAGGLLLGTLCGLAVVPSNAKDDKDTPPKTESPTKPGPRKIAMKAFMRKKLASSQDIIEGLALEDFDLIEKGAKQLKAMSAAAEFMTIDDPLYKDHADDFRRVVAKMEKAAREKRIDGATLGFMDMTMSCGMSQVRADDPGRELTRVSGSLPSTRRDHERHRPQNLRQHHPDDEYLAGRHHARAGLERPA